MTAYFDPTTAPLADVRHALDEACARWTHHMQAAASQQHQADVAQIDASYLEGIVLRRQTWKAAQ